MKTQSLKWIIGLLGAIFLSFPLSVHAENELDPLSRVLAPLVKENLNSLAYGSSYQAMEAFVDALAHEESPERIARLASELRKGTDTSAQFLINIMEQIEKDPAKIERFDQALVEAQRNLKWKVVVPKNHLGSRLIPFTSFGIGLMGLTYGYWSGYLGSSATNIITEHATFISVSLAGAIIAAGFNEFKVLLGAIRNLKRPMQKYFAGQEVLKGLSAELSRYRVSGLGSLTKKHILSVKEDALKEKYAERLKDSATELEERYEQIRRWQLLPALKNFFEQKALKNEIQKFSQALTEEEKQWLRNDVLRAFPVYAGRVSLSAKLRFFESRTRVLFEQWLKDGGQREDLRQVIQQMAAESIQDRMDVYQPRRSTKITMWSLSTGIALMGVVFSIGPEATVLDPIFSETTIEWVRSQSDIFRITSGLFIVGSLGNQIFDIMLLAKNRHQIKIRPGSSVEFNSFLKVLDQVESKIGKNYDGLPVESAGSMIDRLLRSNKEYRGVIQCSAVFQ